MQTGLCEQKKLKECKVVVSLACALLLSCVVAVLLGCLHLLACGCLEKFIEWTKEAGVLLFSWPFCLKAD